MFRFAIIALAGLLMAATYVQPASAHVLLQKDACQNPDFAKLQKSVVSITFEYDTPTPDGYTGHRGTAWFIDETHLATVSHVTYDALSESWRTVTLSWGTQVRKPADKHLDIQARLSKHVDVGLPEKFSIIELQGPVAGFVPAKVRFNALERNEPVLGVAYLGSEISLQYGVGHLSIPEPSGEPDPGADPMGPYLYFELSNEEGQGRHVFDYGTSGGPIFDCNGEVVASVNHIITRSADKIAAMHGAMDSLKLFSNLLPGYQLDLWASGLKRLTHEWGKPNNTGLPASALALE